MKKKTFKITETSLRKIVKEELARKMILTEGSSSDPVVKTIKMDGQKMMNDNTPFKVLGYKPEEVEVTFWDSLISYRIEVTTFAMGEVQPKTMQELSFALVPKMSPMGVQKNTEKFMAVQSKVGNIGEVKQMIKLQLPQGMQVDYN